MLAIGQILNYPRFYCPLYHHQACNTLKEMRIALVCSEFTAQKVNKNKICSFNQRVINISDACIKRLNTLISHSHIHSHKPTVTSAICTFDIVTLF